MLNIKQYRRNSWELNQAQNESLNQLVNQISVSGITRILPEIRRR